MNKFTKLLPILIVALFAAHLYFNTDRIVKKDIADTTIQKPVTQQLDTEPIQNDPNIEEAQVKNNENLLKFKISENSVAVYSVQKRFLNQEDENIIGESLAVTGIGDFNIETNEANLFAEVDLSQLTTGDEKRDIEVQKLFNPKIAKISYNGIFGEEIVFDSENVTKNFLTLEINNIKKDVEFDITYFVTKESGNIKGKAAILMSEFGVTPPSLLNVFTVDDEMEIYFEVSLDKN